jgi:hypothetical protein
MLWHISKLALRRKRKKSNHRGFEFDLLRFAALA